MDFRVEKASLIAAPGRVIVRYDIRDEVNNWSRWSLHVTTDVEAGGNLLAAPRVVDAVSGVIELVKLGNQDAKVQTPVYTERMDPGDRVHLYWLGYTAEGLEVRVELDKEVKTEDIGWPLDFDIPNDKVRAIAQGNAVVRYEVIPLVGTPRRSRRTTVQIIGQVEQLPAPSVEGVVGDVLDPASLPPEGALVRIEKHDLIEGGDSILLLWDGKTASGASLPHTIPIPVTGSGAQDGIERRVSPIHITPLQGGTLAVSYTLSKSGGETLPSYQLPLQVKSLGAQLPKPTVDFAQGDTLDPEAVPVDGTYIRVNYDIETGDRIDVHWDGVLDFTDWFQVPANWGAKEVEFPVAKRYVDLNKDQTVKVFYIVTRGGQPLPASMEQPLLIGTAVELNAPRIKEADDNSLDPLKAKDALTAIVPAYDNMVGTQLSVTWTGTAGAGSHTTEPVQVTTQGDCAVPLPNGVLAFNLNRPVTVHYTVIRNGSPKDSKPFILAVQPIAQQDPAMGRPRIMQAANGGEGPEFDVSQSTSDATISMNSWPLIALRQYVWLRLSGTNSDGSPYTQTFWQPPSSQTNQRWIDQGYYTHPIPLATLQNLKDGSELTVEFKAGLGGSQVEAEALTFQGMRYIVKVTVPLEIDTTDMVLDGPQFYPAPAPYIPAFDKTAYVHTGAHQIRQAHGGRKPYQYTSSNRAVASVDPATGHVISTGNGDARITVHDINGDEVSFNVKSKNVYELVHNRQQLPYFQARAWMGTVGARLFPGSYLSDPLSTAMGYSFQELDASGINTYYCSADLMDNEFAVVSHASGQPAQWESPPFVKGIQAGGGTTPTSSYESLGYRPRNG